MSSRDPTLAEMLEDAIGLFKFGRTEDALHRLDLILERDRGQAGAWFYRGRCLHRMGDIREALSCFRTAADLEPANAVTRCEIGICLDDLGRYIEALDSYGEALRLDPNSHEVLINTGYAFERLGLFDNAIACYREALSHDPLNAAAWLNLGSCLFVSGQPEEAIECFKDAYELAENDEIKLRDRGIEPDELKDKASLGITRCRALLDE
jgi:tetratricopeptide (TPR) repeat protein